MERVQSTAMSHHEMLCVREFHAGSTSQIAEEPEFSLTSPCSGLQLQLHCSGRGSYIYPPAFGLIGQQAGKERDGGASASTGDERGSRSQADLACADVTRWEVVAPNAVRIEPQLVKAVERSSRVRCAAVAG